MKNFAVVISREGRILRWFKTKIAAKAYRKKLNGYASYPVTALKVISKRQAYNS
jgi:hypothetical protein